MNDNNKPGERPDEIPYSLRIEDPANATTWRAYPGPATTIGELMLACHEFGLRVWVDLDGDVCLVDNNDGLDDLPDSAELVAVMWGLDRNPNQVELFETPKIHRTIHRTLPPKT